ncbi:YutD family protein [Aneurinibacillus sp. Ricciae_BoGa-3]|uniref:YutD family protein n=1 Tax=Aneurinibacillus sp. Ricciae_BoGa-3 TaxID=3022697 RepID=UPI0023418375|nr:YutD family protein [Aneurinibacillus sp. Ricciae_BoGa-3]WCK53789.1 YutD family protein [Aneurinibacillus sp. Ricciae_BoGa-3]
MIRVQGNVYELIEENKEGFNLEAFKERYSDILDKFDYVAGDWGYGQLRLKGLFEDTNRKAPYDSRLSFFDEYILEYCNFGCSYFLLKKNKELSQALSEETADKEYDKSESASAHADNRAKDGRETKKRDRRRPRPRRKNKEPRERVTEYTPQQ